MKKQGTVFMSTNDVDVEYMELMSSENAALRFKVERMRVALETIADPKTYEICYDSPITHARAFARAALEEGKE